MAAVTVVDISQAIGDFWRQKDYISSRSHLKGPKGSFHLWKDECVFKMGNLCRRNVKLFLNL